MVCTGSYWLDTLLLADGLHIELRSRRWLHWICLIAHHVPVQHKRASCPAEGNKALTVLSPSSSACTLQSMSTYEGRDYDIHQGGNFAVDGELHADGQVYC